MYKNAPYIFLDEATNSLDNVSQAVVSQNIDRLKFSRLVIAHRLSTIQNADKIIVLKRGNIVQQGTFRELAGTKGYFKELIERQIT
jgi:ABC-type multidrug transport system fused ATPase/permease subunit